jgi:concanavalin A-like lectin/glucanase superfamily protein
MARKFNGSSQYAEKAAASVASGAVTIAAWWKREGEQGGTIVGIGDSNSGHYYALVGTSEGKIQFGPADPTERDSTTTAKATAGTWAHVAGVWTSATSHVAYLNGTAATANTESVSPTGLDRTTIGALVINGSRTSFQKGSIAHVAIWNKALSAAQIKELSEGRSPTRIERENLIDYWELGGTEELEPEIHGNLGLTVSGATKDTEGPTVDAASLSPLWRGTGTPAGSETAINPAYPTAEVPQIGDLVFVEAETQGEGTALTISGAPQPGWQQTELTSVLKGNTRLNLLWTILSCTGGLSGGLGETAPSRTTNDTGNHQIGRVFALKKGTFDPDNPFEAGKSNTQAAGTAVSIEGGTPSLGECLVLAMSAGSGDPASTAETEFSSVANSNLENLLERIDYRNLIADGGSIFLATGTKKTASAIGTTTVTAGTSGEHANASIAVKPFPTTFTAPVPVVGSTTSATERETYELVKDGLTRSGDICIISLYTNDTATNGSSVEGGTLVKEKRFAGSFRHYVFWVKHDGTAKNIKVTMAEKTFSVVTTMWYRGCDQTEPVEASAIEQAAGTKVTVSALTTKGKNRRIVTTEANSSGFPPTGYPTGVRARVDYSPGIADKVQAAEGSTGTAVYEVGSANLSAAMLVLKPAESGKALKIELADAVAPAESRGAKDAMKRADTLASVADSRSLRPALKRADSQALADALKKAVVERRADTFALAELLKRAVGEKRVDTLALSEKLAKALGIRKGDALVIVEAMKRRAGKALADSAAPTEKRVAQAGLGKADSVGLNEKLIRAAGRRQADGVLLAELLAHAWHATRSLGDSIPLDDEFVVFIGKALEFHDAALLSDALVRVWAAHSGLADTLAPAEARQLRAALKRADTAAVVEQIHKLAGPSRQDSLSVTDARRLAAGKGLAEHISVIDAIHPSEGISMGNLVAVTDAVSRAWAAKLSRSDTFGLADTARRAAGRHLAESVGLTEQNSRSWEALRTAEDVFEVVDAVETFSAKGTQPHEVLHVHDALARMWEAILDRADAVTVVEAHRLSYGRFLHESVNLPEEHLRSLGKHFANQIALTEHLQRSLAKARAESVGASDAIHKAHRKSFAELVFAQDDRHSLFTEALEEALALSEARASAASKARAESIATSDQRRIGTSRPIHESAAFGDQVRRTYQLNLRDSILPLEFRVRSTGLGRAEALTISEAIDVLRVLGVILDEALEIADGIAKGEQKAFHDLAELKDKVAPHAIAAHLAILTLVDALSTQTTLDDSPELSAALDDRAGTTLSVSDGLS